MSHFKEEEKKEACQRKSGTAPGRPAGTKVLADCVRTPRQPASCFVQASFKYEKEISNEKEGEEKKTSEQTRGRGFNGEGELELCYLCCFVSREVYSSWRANQ